MRAVPRKYHAIHDLALRPGAKILCLGHKIPLRQYSSTFRSCSMFLNLLACSYRSEQNLLQYIFLGTVRHCNNSIRGVIWTLQNINQVASEHETFVATYSMYLYRKLPTTYYWLCILVQLAYDKRAASAMIAEVLRTLLLAAFSYVKTSSDNVVSSISTSRLYHTTYRKDAQRICWTQQPSSHVWKTAEEPLYHLSRTCHVQRARFL